MRMPVRGVVSVARAGKVGGCGDCTVLGTAIVEGWTFTSLPPSHCSSLLHHPSILPQCRVPRDV